MIALIIHRDTLKHHIDMAKRYYLVYYMCHWLIYQE